MKVDQIPHEFQTVNRSFEQVAASRDFSKLDQVYTQSARILPPGAETVTGLRNIQEFWQAAASAMDLKSLTLNTVELEIAGDTALEIGRADLVTGLATPTTMTAKYVVHWKKQDGAWRWDVDIWNAASA